MAIAKTYYVSFFPAERQAWGGYSIRFTIGGKADITHTVTGDLATLEREVIRLAREYGRTCSPYIRQRTGDRAVPGFKALCIKLNIIDVEAVAA